MIIYSLIVKHFNICLICMNAILLNMSTFVLAHFFQLSLKKNILKMDSI